MLMLACISAHITRTPQHSGPGSQLGGDEVSCGYQAALEDEVAMTRDQVLEFVKGNPVAFMGTVEGGHPGKMRPMGRVPRGNAARVEEHMNVSPGRRISVVGTTGSGKTTVGRAMADRLGVPFVELDALAWLPGWVSRPLPELRPRVEERTRGPAWVVDGNYSKVRDIVWGRADTVVWLDHPFRQVFGGLLRRTVLRCARNEELWSGNRESFRMAFFSRDSILVWAIRTHRRHAREYPKLLAQPEHAHLKVIRLRSRREARQWLDGLPKPLSSGPSQDFT